MRLARRMGLTVPDVSRRYVPEPLYLIERFDRSLGPAGVQRLHAIDACQLLNLDRQFKYQQGSIEVLAKIASLCRNKLQTRWRLYDWLIFNILTGNNDAPLKNLRSEEHTSELQSLMRISYAVFCLKTKHKSLTLLKTSKTHNHRKQK